MDIQKGYCYYGKPKLCVECFESCEYRRKNYNIIFDTQRFETLGETLEFLKKYSKDNYKKNDGLNLLSNHEIISIIGFLEIFIDDYNIVFEKIEELKNRTRVLTDRNYYDGANDALNKLKNELIEKINSHKEEVEKND